MLRFFLIWSLWSSVALANDPLMLQFQRSQNYLFENLDHPDATAGAVIASPSKANPDYFFHWVRDAALTMNAVLNLFEQTGGTAKENLRQRVEDYIAFSRRNQENDALTGLGEPKFFVDGRAYFGPWGRPQNDGPALRAITLTRYARILLSEGRGEEVRNVLYDGRISTDSVIKRDLEYVAHHWREPSFEIWEEVLGTHFYTLLVQHRALKAGAELAQVLNDGGAASFYLQQAEQIQNRLNDFYDSRQNAVIATIDRHGGLDYKDSGLDSQVILAVNHAAGNDGVFSHSDERLLATFAKLEEVFSNAYEINKQGHDAVGIGRYTEDRYTGYDSAGQGNPWFLAGLGMAEYLKRFRADVLLTKSFSVTAINKSFYERLLKRPVEFGVYSEENATFREVITRTAERANAYLQRTLFHADRDGRMSEQINRNNGFMQGANDLTWNYAAFITAYMFN